MKNFYVNTFHSEIEAKNTVSNYYKTEFGHSGRIGIKNASGINIEYYSKDDPEKTHTFHCILDDGFDRSCVNAGLLTVQKFSFPVSTTEAIESIMSKPRWYLDLGYSISNGKVMAMRYREGKLSLDKIEEIITKAGYTVKQEKTWQK